MSVDVIAGWVVWFIAAIFVSWTYRMVRNEVHGKRPLPLNKCRDNIRRMETEIYGCVVSGSLIKDADITEHDEVAERIKKELAPPPPPRRAVDLQSAYQRKQKEIIRLAYEKQFENLNYAKYHSQIRKSKYCGCAICGRSKIHHLR